MKKYIKPEITVVTLSHSIHLLAGSEISGGGDKGSYTEGTQEARGSSFWDDEE